MKVFVASDHAGFERKNELMEFAKKNLSSFEWIDLGPNSDDRVDYPDFADQVAYKVNAQEGLGLLICGSGQGMAIRANKFTFVRAALCWDEESTKLSREHNDANILCLGGRLISLNLSYNILKIFFTTEFQGGRHTERVKKISFPIK